MKLKRCLISFLLLLLTGCAIEKSDADAYGNFEAKEILISAELNGKITSKLCTAGQQVQKGDILCLQDTTDLMLKKKELQTIVSQTRIKISQAQSQIILAELSLKKSEKERKRFQNLLEAESATQKQVDDLIFQENQRNEQFKQAKLLLQQAFNENQKIKIKIQQVQNSIDKSIVRSPISGTILTDYFESGEIVTFKTPLCKIANTETMTLVAYFDGVQVNRLELGQIVKIGIDKSATDLEFFNGTISTIAEKSEFSPKNIQTKEERVTRVYRVEIMIKNNGKLKIGMPAEVYL